MARILVIEDDEAYQRMIQVLLEREGHQVTTASDGKEGIRLFKENPVELIITDIYMPEKDGLETITELKPEFPEVKIIAVSGGGSRGWKDSTLVMAEDLGADAVLSKPFEKAELFKTIEELLMKNR